MKMLDPLFVVNPKQQCPQCHGEKSARKKCEYCRQTGVKPVDISGLWAPASAFLVCGGPSLRQINPERLRERGVLSLAINNAGGFLPTSAHVFSDPQWKFHHGMFGDGKNLTFCPTGKLGRAVRLKLQDGSFRFTNVPVGQFPGVVGFARRTIFKAETFLTDWFAHWGRGGKQDETSQPFRRLATMLLGFRLLHYLGCPRIYLLGADFWMTKENPYAWGGTATSGNRLWAKINYMLAELRQVFEEADFRCFNCNPNSNCDAFEFVPFEIAMKDVKGIVPSEPFDLEDWYSHGIQKKSVCPQCGGKKRAKRRCEYCGHSGLWPVPVGFEDAAGLIQNAEALESVELEMTNVSPVSSILEEK